MRTVRAIIACMLICGCSPRETSQRSSLQVFTFVDGSVMQVQKRNGQTLEGIHLVERSHEGSQTCDAEKGRMTEDATGQIVHVILYDAKVELASEQRMQVREMQRDFIRITHK